MRKIKPYAATNANLLAYGLEPTMQLLIAVALDSSLITYGELGKKLENQAGFSKIFTTRIGFLVGSLMHKIENIEPDAPLINVLVVNQRDWQPSKGAGYFMGERFDESRLSRDDAKTKFPMLWKRSFERAASEVYKLPAKEWATIYRHAFSKPLALEKIEKARLQRQAGTEKDGIPFGRKYGSGGEGPEHKALRLWVQNNPGSLDSAFAKATAETEVDLDSGDRVDVVYKLVDRIIVIEVKSMISNETDLNRGVFQCIKYRAVRAAMDVRGAARVEAILVTELDLPNRVAKLVALHGIRHIRIPAERA